MPLLTLHTRLADLLAEAQFMRQTCAVAVQALASDVAAAFVVNLAQTVQVSINNVAGKESDTDLVAYAAEQFAGQDWIPLDQQIVGVRALLTVVVVACIATATADSDGYIQTQKWNADGSVTARVLSTTDTASLKAALGTVMSAIPE